MAPEIAYKEINCPLPQIDKLREMITDNINSIFYPDDCTDECQLAIKNEIVFIDNGILLFGRFNVFIGADGIGCVKVLTPIDIFWLEKLDKIYNNFQHIISQLTAYCELITIIGTASDCSYFVVENIILKCKNIVNGEKLVFALPSQIAYGFDRIELSINRMNNITFQYEIIGYKRMNTVVADSEMMYEIASSTFQLSRLTEFINKLYFNYEIIK